jgi:hypothetical protein
MPERSGADRQDRANRVLDTARELLLSWGYRRVTIDELSRRAGVGKGTIFGGPTRPATPSRRRGPMLMPRMSPAGGPDRVELHTRDMTDLAFPDESFDLIVSSLAIHNYRTTPRGGQRLTKQCGCCARVGASPSLTSASPIDTPPGSGGVA